MNPSAEPNITVSFSSRRVAAGHDTTACRATSNRNRPHTSPEIAAEMKTTMPTAATDKIITDEGTCEQIIANNEQRNLLL
jgi:hypothetical protein